MVENALTLNQNNRDIYVVIMKIRIKNVIIYDRRKKKAAIPRNYLRYLNEDQVNTYIRMKESGWRMYFIRRPRLRKHTIAMINNAGTSIGVIQQSGLFAFNPMPIKLRDLGEH